MIKVKHIVVTRLAVKWRFKDTKLNWDEWLRDSIKLMDTFCRPSLKNQSTQDFTLLSLVDESVEQYGNVLDNEVILKIKSKEGDYPKKEMVNKINEYVSTLKDYDYVIVSRIDRDDCLHYRFLELVQLYLSGSGEKYVDLNYSITLSTKTKTAHDSRKYFNTFVSPFVSTYEKIVNGKIRCISIINDHDKVSKFLVGKKVNDLIGIQVIHDNNLKNKIYGKPININYKDYGIHNYSGI
ncbi:MAG: glycosyltransferase [bacterium]